MELLRTEVSVQKGAPNAMGNGRGGRLSVFLNGMRDPPVCSSAEAGRPRMSVVMARRVIGNERSLTNLEVLKKQIR